MKLFDSLLSSVAPHSCLACLAEGAVLCKDCRHGLAPAVPRCYKCQQPSRNFATCDTCRPDSPLGSVLSVAKYEQLAKDILWKLKFGRAQSASAEIGRLISSRLHLRRLSQRSGGAGIIVTHAPTATNRVRTRGYDQAALIARALARDSGAAYAPLLGRRGHQKQIGATRSQRTQQLSGAFQVRHLARIRGRHILLVDDVVTTGATLEAAAAALMAAGARGVDAIVFAQA